MASRRLASSFGALARAPLASGAWRPLAMQPRSALPSFPRHAGMQGGASQQTGLGGAGAAAARSGLARLVGQRGFHGSAGTLAHFPIRGSDDLQMVHLGNLADNPGARQPRKRSGRGTGSGRGKMRGFGHKGQKARAGNKGLLGFEGGQTPAQKRYPKRGFTNKHAFISKFTPLSLNNLMYYVNTGRLDTSSMITMKQLRDCGAIQSSLVDVTGVKLLKGTLEKVNKPVHIEVSDFSAEAKRLVEEAGGSVKKGYYNRLGLRALLKPEKFDTIPKRAAPPPRLLWKYPEHYKDVEAQLAAKASGEMK